MGTPPTTSQLKESIDWAASTHTTEVTLQAENPFDDDLTVDEIQRLMVKHLKRKA